MKSFFYYLLIGFFCITSSVSALAANLKSSGFTVSPPFQEIGISTNDLSKEFYVNITNNSSLSQSFTLSVLDFGSLDESGGAVFLGSKPNEWQKKYGLASWVSLEKDSVVIESKSSQKVKIIIDNKESLSPGGHYAGLIIKLVSNATKGNNTVGINQVFTSLIFVKKIGGEKYDLLLKSVNLNNFYLFLLPDELKLRFQNRGNVHMIPRGLMTIQDPFGRVVKQGVINSESSIIIPESFRIYTSSFHDVSLAFWPGKYTANIQYRFDGKDSFSSVKYSFYFCGLFLPISIAVILTIFWYIKLKKPKKSTE